MVLPRPKIRIAEFMAFDPKTTPKPSMPRARSPTAARRASSTRSSGSATSMSDGSPSVKTMTSFRKLRAWLISSPAWRSAVPSRVDRPDDNAARRPTHPQRDSRLQHRIDIEIVTVELPLQPDGSADAHAANQPPDPVAQNVGALERLFHDAWIAGPRQNLAYRGPFRAFDAVRAIPFRIFRNHNAALVRRDGPRPADFAFVLNYVRMYRGLIRIVALLKARRVDGKIEGFAGGGCVLAKIPQAQTVVAIDRFDDVGLGVELHAHLAEIVAQQHAALAADRRVFQTRKPGLEYRAPLGDKTVVVFVSSVEQGPGQPREQGRGRGDAGRHGDMIGRP